MKLTSVSTLFAAILSLTVAQTASADSSSKHVAQSVAGSSNAVGHSVVATGKFASGVLIAPALSVALVPVAIVGVMSAGGSSADEHSHITDGAFEIGDDVIVKMPKPADALKNLENQQ